MLLFRSEEDAPRTGATVPIEQLNRLAIAWYGNRLRSDWRPRRLAESQGILHGVGLTGEFWKLA